MNKIFKVIYSKVRNCYVVTSEFAKANTKSSTGSAKQTTKKSLLSLAIAVGIACSGFVNVGATVHVNEVTDGTKEVYETSEVYDKSTVDEKINKVSEDITTNKNNIAALNTSKANADTVYTKEQIYTKDEVNTELDKKANADTVYTKDQTYTKDEVNTELGKKANADTVYTKEQTYTRTEVEAKLTEAGTSVDTKLVDYAKTADVNTELAKKADKDSVYSKTEANTTFATKDELNTTKNELDDKVTNNANGIQTNKEAIADLKTKVGDASGGLTKDVNDLTGRVNTVESSITDLKDKDVALEAKINANSNDITGLRDKDVELGGKIDTVKSELNAKIDNTKTELTTADAALGGRIDAEKNEREAADTALGGRIDTEKSEREAADTAINTKIGTIDDTQTTYVKNANSISQNLTKLDEKLKDTNDRTAGIKRDDVHNETVIEGKVTVDNEGNISNVKDLNAKTITTTGKAEIGGKLTVKGDLVTEKSITNKKDENNYTKIDGGHVTSKNLEVNGAGQSISSSSTFNAEENKIGFANNATGNQSFHKQDESGFMDNVKDNDNSNNRTQTKTETKNTITDKDENSSTISQTASENKTYLEDKGKKNTNTTVDTAKDYNKTIQGEHGKTSTSQDELNITNTAEAGTITNDAKDIVNSASGNIKNSSATMDTTVSGKATESYGELETTVTKDEKHTVNGSQTNIIGGNQMTTVTGDISNSATNITNTASEKLTDKAGENTRVIDKTSISDTVGNTNRKMENGKIDDTIQDAAGNGSSFRQRIDAIMGNVKSADGESEVIQNGNQITSVVGKGETTNSKVTQTKDMLQTALTDGTNYNVSQDVANASAKLLTDGTKINKTQDNLDSSEKTMTNGTYKTSSLQTALDITNTAKDGTIKNDAKNIENIASGNIKNSSATMETTVTGKATESYGELETTIKGNQSTTVEGNVTEDYKKDLTTKVGGNELHEVTGKVTENFKGGQETNVTGDQTTTVSGTQTTNATDINRNASSGMIDKVDNAYGTNTETKVAGKTTTEVTIKGTGEKGEYIRGANEAKDTLTKGTLKNSETKTVEATSTEITDGSGNTSSTIQDKGQISGSVTNGTDKAVSNVKADSIDSAVIGAGSSSVINQKKDSITSSVGNGTTSTVIQQGEKDITIASNGGTVAISGKDIINNASGNMTNIVGGNLTTTVTGKTTEEYKNGLDTTVTGAENHNVTGKQTNTIEGGQENIISGGQTNTITGDQKTTVTGDISNSAKNITNEASEKLTDKVGTNTRVLDREGITDTVGNTSFKQRIDDIMMEAKNGTITSDAKNIMNKATETITNEAVDITNTATGIISSNASEIKNKADKLISNKVGENTYQNIEDGKITESIKNGTKQNLTQSDANGTNHSVVDGKKSSVIKQTSEELTGAVSNGSSSNVTQNTATSSNNTIADLDANGKPTKANSVISTVDGTEFINSNAAAPVTGASGTGTADRTTIKGNTITTGKVTMDYADVMKDLGVRGNANITGKTTTGSLEVTGTSTLKGDVTMESNATVKNDLTVEGTTTTNDLKVTQNATIGGTLDVTGKASFKDSVDVAKDLTVGGNATITGDVTANSYKVGNKTYIDSNGINANGQVIRNVGVGEISETSTDAVNGSQLFATNRRIEQFDSRINEVGANAAAIANLHPMEFDADSKLNVAVGVGNYRNKTATAMGVFYRPNEDVMFNVSSTIGSNDNMVGGGVSFRLGSGGNKQKNKAIADAAEQNKQLKSQVDTLQAQMDALLSVINPNMSKDFPDVPDNHWAYEAVSRLAGNDIIQGYEDGKYHGERTMTRYEMAAIIYKALQKGAKAEAKLVEEFKPELKALAAHEKA